MAEVPDDPIRADTLEMSVQSITPAAFVDPRLADFRIWYSSSYKGITFDVRKRHGYALYLATFHRSDGSMFTSPEYSYSEAAKNSAIYHIDALNLNETS